MPGMDEALQLPPKIGRYEIQDRLGQGGMAMVYRGRDPHFKRDVALKLLPPQLTLDPMFAQRFRREAETIAALEHPAIVPVYDFGEENGQLYLVMRLMTGGSLADRLEEGPLPLPEVMRITERIAAALDRAHNQGVIHRDLKPANILFDQYGEAYLADFGIARLAQSSATLTGEGFIGTPAYSSPEQIEGKPVDGRSDIYALGIILFEMLTGQKPYQADTPAMLLVKQMTEPTPRVLDIDPTLPPTCELAITQAMEKDVAHRFSTAGQVMDTLKGEPIAAQPAAAQPPSTAAPPPAAPLPRARRPRVQIALVGGVFLLFCCLGGLAIAARSGRNGFMAGLIRSGSAGPGDLPPGEVITPENAATLALLAQMGRGTIDALRLSPDESTLAVGGSLGVWLYDAETLAPLKLLQGHTRHVTAVAWSPDGAQLASSSWDQTIRIWDVAAGVQRALLDGPDNEEYLTLDWSPDGELLAAGTWHPSVELWDVQSGVQVQVDALAGHNASITHVAWSPGGEYLATAGGDGALIVYARSGFAPVQEWALDSGGLTCLRWSPDGSQLAACGNDEATVHILTMDNAAPVAELVGHAYGVTAVAWAADGSHLLSNDGDYVTRLWDMAAAQTTRQSNLFTDFVLDVVPAYSRGQVIFATGQGELAIGQMQTLQINSRLQEHTGSMWALSWSPGDEVATVGSDTAVRVWNTATAEAAQRLHPEQETYDAFATAWSTDGAQLVAAWDNGRVQFWQTDTWEYNTWQLESSASSVAWSPDNQYLALGGLEGQVAVWQVASGEVVWEQVEHAAFVTALAWSPDGAWLASSGEDGLAFIWNGATGALGQRLEGHGAEVTAVAWSPDGREVATGSFDHTVRIWQAQTGEMVREFSRHTELVTSVAWSPDGALIASGGWDYLVRVWDAASGREYARLDRHVGPVLSVAWSRDGRRLASSSQDGTVIVWGQ